MEIDLEAYDSSSIQNSRRVHSSNSSISSSVSNFISHSTSNSSPIYSFISLSRPSQQFLPVSEITDSAIVINRNLPVVIQINESRNEPILSLDIPC